MPRNKGDSLWLWQNLISFRKKTITGFPEHVRAELIDGQFYDMAIPSRMHQIFRWMLILFRIR